MFWKKVMHLLPCPLKDLLSWAVKRRFICRDWLSLVTKLQVLSVSFILNARFYGACVHACEVVTAASRVRCLLGRVCYVVCGQHPWLFHVISCLHVMILVSVLSQTVSG